MLESILAWVPDFILAWLPESVIALIWIVVKIIAIVLPLILTVAYYTYAERKIIGYMQVRMGPNRVGPWGLFQPFADVFKLLLKEIVLPADSNRFLFILAPILSIRIVDDLHQAIEHINRYGSKHTDAIVSENYSSAREFLRRVDSSSVIVNASTGFADGFEYGLGAEIGISTDKLHARGPVGLEGLTSQKYVVFGDGNLRA